MGSAAYRAKNREALAAKQREYRAANLDRINVYRSENAEQIAEYQRVYSKEWRRRNADRIKAKRREYYANNAEKAKAAVRAWQEENPGRRRSWARENARARLLGRDEGAVAYAQILRSDPCSYCGASVDTIDHLIPVSAGGTNDWTNLTGACRSCNSGKHTRPLLAYLLERAA